MPYPVMQWLTDLELSILTLPALQIRLRMQFLYLFIDV